MVNKTFINNNTTEKFIFLIIQDVNLNYMINIKQISFFFIILFLLSCQTINQKTDEIAQKENKKLSKFIGQPETELKIVMGKPNSEIKDEKGNKILVYKNKKFGISCERKFEINESSMVIGFTSKGCF